MLHQQEHGPVSWGKPAYNSIPPCRGWDRAGKQSLAVPWAFPFCISPSLSLGKWQLACAQPLVGEAPALAVPGSARGLQQPLQSISVFFCFAKGWCCYEREARWEITV